MRFVLFTVHSDQQFNYQACTQEMVLVANFELVRQEPDAGAPPAEGYPAHVFPGDVACVTTGTSDAQLLHRHVDHGRQVG